MITEKQRRRALARAKWERQRARRTAAERRARVLQIIGGAAVGVVAVVLVGWGAVHVFTDDSNSRSPNIPTETFRTDLLTPTDNRAVTSFIPPTSPTTTRGSRTTGTGATTPPVTTPPVTTPPVTSPSTPPSTQ